MIVVYKRYGKQRDGHWLLNSVLLYHKMQFVQFVLHRQSLSSTDEVCPQQTRFVLHRRSLSSTDFNLFLVLLRLVTHFRLQFDKLPCHLVRGPLAKDPQDGPPSLVHIDPPSKGKPASARALVHDVFELHHGDADKLVVATEAVVLDADVQLVRGHLLLVADDEVEGLVELWRPIAGLLFCLELPLLIRKVRSYQVDLHVRLEGLGLLNLQVVRSNNFQGDFVLASSRVCVQVHLHGNLAHASLLRRRRRLTVLRGDKVLDEGVCSLGVEGECVLQGLQLLRLVHVGHLQTVSSGVEVLLDNVQGILQHGTLLWSQALWPVVL